MKNNECYIHAFIRKDKQCFLLWFWESEVSSDTYFYTLPETSKLLITSSEDNIKNFIFTNKFNLINLVDEFSCVNEVSIINLNNMYKELFKLKSYRRITLQAANILNDAWNALEDFERTLNIDLGYDRIGSKEEIDFIYEKIFHGCNICNPTEKLYHPMFTPRECHILKLILRRGWAKVNSLLFNERNWYN